MSDSGNSVLQDYLDGRLSPGDRAEFERRLQRDPELARRARELRRIGDALRGGTEALSPEFYARARERFEARRPRRWFRPLSVETAGLAAAVVLAIAVFVPPILDREDLGIPPPTSSAADTKTRAVAKLDSTSRLSETEIDRDAEAADDKNIPATTRETARDVTSEVDRSVAREPADRLAQKKAADPRREAAPSAPSAVAELKENAPKRKDTDGNEFAAGVADRRAAAEQERQSDAPRQAGVYEELAKVAPAESLDDAEASGETSGVGGRSRMQAEPQLLDATDESDRYFDYRANAYPLAPVGGAMVGAGELRVLSGDDAQALLSSLGNENEGSDATPDRRLVLIGPRDRPFSCRTITIRAYEDHYGLVFAPPADDAQTGHLACAVVLPDDGRAVTVEGGDD